MGTRIGECSRMCFAAPPQTNRTTSSKSLTGAGLLSDVTVRGRPDHIVEGSAVRRQLRDVGDLAHLVDGYDAFGHAVVRV